MKDAKRLNRLIVVRERMLSVRRSELAQASAALVQAQDAAVRVGAALEHSVHALAHVEEMLPEDLALRASTVREAVEGVRRAEAVCVERTTEREAQAVRAFEAKRDVRVLEELEVRLSKVERREEARREQATTDETAARTRGNA